MVGVQTYLRVIPMCYPVGPVGTRAGVPWPSRRSYVYLKQGSKSGDQRLIVNNSGI